MSVTAVGPVPMRQVPIAWRYMLMLCGTPLIDPAFLTAQRDVDFMVRAARTARNLVAAHAFETDVGQQVLNAPADGPIGCPAVIAGAIRTHVRTTDRCQPLRGHCHRVGPIGGRLR